MLSFLQHSEADLVIRSTRRGTGGLERPVEGRRMLAMVAVAMVVILANGATSHAQVAEIDGYDRAVTHQSKDAALAFIDEFSSSHLVDDLIQSLRPDVAREVCSSLDGGPASARRACRDLPEAPPVEQAIAPAAGGAEASPAVRQGAAAAASPSTSVIAPGEMPRDSAGNQAPAPGAASPPAEAAPIDTVASPASVDSAANPAPVPQPAAPPASVGGGAIATAVLPSAGAPAPGIATAGNYRIQLLSTKSRDQTESAWQELQMAYPDVLRDLEFNVVEVDLGAAKGGVWYRGLAGPLTSKDEAEMLCLVIRSSPPYSDCFVAAY